MKEKGWVLRNEDGKFYSVDEDDFFDTPEEGCFFFFEEDAQDVNDGLLEDGMIVELVPATYDGTVEVLG